MSPPPPQGIGSRPLLPQLTLQRHYTKNWKQIFPEKERCGLSPNSYINVSGSDLYIPILLQLQEIGGPIVGIYKSHDIGNREFGTIPYL